MNKVIEEAIKEGAIIFDFLSGDEPYKFRWADSIRKNVRIMCWRNNIKYMLSEVDYTIKRGFRKISEIVRYFEKHHQ